MGVSGDLGDGDELPSAAELDPSPATPPSSVRSGLGCLASTGGEAILRTSQGAAAAWPAQAQGAAAVWPAQAPRRKRGMRSGAGSGCEQTRRRLGCGAAEVLN